VSQPVGTAGIQKSGDGTLRLTANNTYAGLTVVNGGILQVDGSQPQSNVQINSGTLQGNGTVGIVSFTGLGGAIAPGASPGILSCQGLGNGGGTGTLQVELNGPSPGSGYDQLNVASGFDVNLTGISLKASLGYQSSVGNRFTILNNNNEGVLRISGTFAGLPQGKRFYIGQELFQINYRGGDGNDLVLTRLTTPPPPQLTIERASSNSVRLVWPTNDPPFSLQAATNLPSTNWLAASPQPLVAGTNNVVTNATAGGQNLYRLSSP
jgi:autotransporter-associated beta strand protein